MVPSMLVNAEPIRVTCVSIPATTTTMSEVLIEGIPGPALKELLIEKPWHPQQSLSPAPASLPTWPYPASSPPTTMVPILFGLGESVWILWSESGP